MVKKSKRQYPDIISVRLSRNEKREFDVLMRSLNTNSSAFIRKKIKEILKTITKNQ
jgi:predicted CopG family antitoxin